MENNEKPILTEEELKKVAGGADGTFRCPYCGHSSSFDEKRALPGGGYACPGCRRIVLLSN